MALPFLLPYAISGNDKVVGAAAAVAPSPNVAAAVTVRVDGPLAATAPAPVVDVDGRVLADGPLAVTALVPTVAGAVTATVAGPLAASAPMAVVDIDGRAVTDGPLSVTAPAPTFSGPATALIPAVLDVEAPLPTFGFVVEAEAAALLTAVAPMATVLLTDAGRSYTFPEYSVQIDWNNDGDWTDGNEDVTEDVAAVAGVAIQYGRDAAKTLSPTAGGTAGMELDNVSEKYTPANEASPLYGLLLPGRPVRMQVTIGPSTYSLFYGHTDDSPLDPDITQQSVTMSMLDGLAKVRGQNVSTSLYRGIRTGEAIGYVLDAIDWPVGMRDLDMGATVLPWWWCSEVDAYEAIVELVKAEGPPALLSIGPAGEITFRDRHHRLLEASSRDVQAYWSARSLAEGSRVTLSWGDVINRVEFEVQEREPDPELSAVWQTEDVVTLTPGESYVYRVIASEPFTDAVTPVANTDFVILTGGLASITLSRTSGQRVSITVTADANHTQIMGMALRAIAIPVRRTWVVQAEDTTSIAKYGRRSWPDSSGPASVHDARAQAALIIDRHADPLPSLTARFVATSGSDLGHQVARDLSDRVEIPDHTALGGQWFIDSISHRFDGRVGHETVFTCERARAIGATEERFTLGSATDGVLGSNKLGRIQSIEAHNVLILGSASNGVIGTNRIGF